MELKPICLIAVRGGSKGVPGKNLKNIGGKPLLVHGIHKVIKSKLFSHVIVSTEDKKIASLAKRSGADVPFIRPKKLATDAATTIDVILHANKKLERLGYKFDVIVNLDITSPFIRTNDIKGALLLLKKKKCDAVFGVYNQHLNPYFNIVEKNSKGFLQLVKKPKVLPRSRQSAPTVYQMSGFHVLQKTSFLKHKTWYMPKILPYEIPIETGLMIDTNYEFQIAKHMFKIFSSY
tara:strand:+ start:6475 stop:7176 length:702 start_codon:yes stop_codon:yes gene_type:complete